MNISSPTFVWTTIDGDRDFQEGDNVIVQNPKTRERTKGILVSTSKRPAMVTIRDVEGVEHTARLNHVVFLQAPKKGWLHK
jgi:hypothetical protein